MCTILMQIPWSWRCCPQVQSSKYLCASATTNLRANATQRQGDHEFRPSFLTRWHWISVQTSLKAQRQYQSYTQIQTLYRYKHICDMWNIFHTPIILTILGVAIRSSFPPPFSCPTHISPCYPYSQFLLSSSVSFTHSSPFLLCSMSFPWLLQQPIKAHAPGHACFTMKHLGRNTCIPAHPPQLLQGCSHLHRQQVSHR